MENQTTRVLLLSFLAIVGSLTWTSLNAQSKSVPFSSTASSAAKKSATATATPTASHLSVTAGPEAAETKSRLSATEAKKTPKSALADDQCTFKAATEEKCETPKKKK